MLIRAADWDEIDELRKVVKDLRRIMRREFRVEEREGMARLVILRPRAAVTGYMAVPELRALVEGIRLGL